MPSPLMWFTIDVVLLTTTEEVQKTVDDILTASKSLDTPSLVPDTLTADDKNSMEVVDMTKEDTLDDVSLLAFEMPPTESESCLVPMEIPPPTTQAVSLT